MHKKRLEIRSRYIALEPEEESLIEYSTIKAFELHYNWKGLIQKRGVPAGEAYAEALYMINRKPYNRPTSLSIANLLRRYSDAVRNGDDHERGLVRMALLANSEETRLKDRVKALNDIDNLHQSYRYKDPAEVKQPRRADYAHQVLVRRPKIFIDAQHGLGNRLRAIGSAAAIAEATNRELVIVWQSDDHCGCQFTDLFDYKGAVLDVFQIKDTAGFEFYDYMCIDAGKQDPIIRCDGNADIYARSAFVLNSPHSNWTRENHFLQTLKPVETVQALVNSVRHPNDVSAHVRMVGGRKYEHLSYESSVNWSADSHALIEYWRSKSHFSHFMKRIDSLVAVGAAEHIFIAADMPETYEEFRKVYGDKLVWLERNLYDRSADQLPYALADAILLSRSKLLLGSSWSSFSELAIRLAPGGLKTEMSGKDF